MPIDYNKAKIYCIRSPNTDLIYIGSTCQLLCQRMAGHKANIKYLKNITSKIIFDYGEPYIELLENYPCNNKEELLKKEGEHIRNNNCCNKKIEGRTDKEYYIDNKDKFKQYSINNKEKIKEYVKQYCKTNKEEYKEYQKEYRENNKETAKQYYEDNKEKVKQYYEKYREKNKEKAKQYAKQYIENNKKNSKNIN